MRYFYNSWDPAYKSHFGAIARNQSCQFTIRLPEETPLDFSPVLVVFRTGFKERFLPMNVKEHENGYVTYTTDLIPKYSGVHYYYFSYTSNGVRHYIKRGDACHGTLDQGEMFQLTVYNEDYQTPQFLKGGVMYQIFPDRFCSSGKMHDNVPSDRVMREWGELPYYKPDQNGHVWNNDYFGGDLDGIRSKLDYLKDLGVTCIYLNPIFESHENHRYNTANYRNVDPLLGTNEDFRELCKAAKVRGISVILDGVFSHTGADSIYFNKFGRYNTPGAYQSENSPYYSWYHFWGNKEYESWWGIDTLPNVDENNPSYTKYICGDDGVLDYWMSLGAAGYRLDVADELPDEFLDNLRTCVKKYDEEKIVIGEVWEDASNKEAYGVKRRYLLGDQLDSVMNYPFRNAILGYILTGNADDFLTSVVSIVENYPPPAMNSMMNSLSTHDTPRAITVLVGESMEGKDRPWQAAHHYLSLDKYARGQVLLKLASTLQYFLPGIPCLYYGDEAGLSGYADPFNRCCYPWGYENQELIAFFSELGKLRLSMPFLTEASFIPLVVDEALCCYLRCGKNKEERALIAINRSNQPRTLPLPKDFTDAEAHILLGEYHDGVLCGESAVVLEDYPFFEQ